LSPVIVHYPNGPQKLKKDTADDGRRYSGCINQFEHANPSKQTESKMHARCFFFLRRQCFLRSFGNLPLLSKSLLEFPKEQEP